MKRGNFRRYFATLIVLFLLAFLLFTIYKFVNGFFGALILYVVLLPVYNFLNKKKLNKNLSAVIAILIAFFVIIIPLLFVLGIVGNQIFNLFQNTELLGEVGSYISKYISTIFPALSKEFISEQLTSFGISASSLFLNILSNTGFFVVNLLIALFLLYFMLVKGPWFRKVEKVIPFNKKNSKELVDKLKDISYSTILVSGIIALIQGALLTVTFLVFGISGAFLWGFVTAVLSFIPIVGPPFVWIPAVIIQFFQGNYAASIGVLVFGIVLSNIDNFIRPYFGKKISRIHPLVTLIGIFIGVLLFGLIGIFVGPLLISFSISVLRMFKEEYYS